MSAAIRWFGPKIQRNRPSPSAGSLRSNPFDFRSFAKALAKDLLLKNKTGGNLFWKTPARLKQKLSDS